MQAIAGTDSSAARGISLRFGSGRVRHLRTQDLWIQERVREKDWEVKKVDNEHNRADLNTKYLEGGHIAKLLHAMGLTTRGLTLSHSTRAACLRMSGGVWLANNLTTADAEFHV